MILRYLCYSLDFGVKPNDIINSVYELLTNKIIDYSTSITNEKECKYCSIITVLKEIYFKYYMCSYVLEIDKLFKIINKLVDNVENSEDFGAISDICLYHICKHKEPLSKIFVKIYKKQVKKIILLNKF